LVITPVIRAAVECQVPNGCPSNVPEPSSFMMLGSGLIALGGSLGFVSLRRKR
jgi:hypothetical protein